MEKGIVGWNGSAKVEMFRTKNPQALESIQSKS